MTDKLTREAIERVADRLERFANSIPSYPSGTLQRQMLVGANDLRLALAQPQAPSSISKCPVHHSSKPCKIFGPECVSCSDSPCAISGYRNHLAPPQEGDDE